MTTARATEGRSDFERCNTQREAACSVAERFGPVLLCMCPAALADIAWAMAGRGLFVRGAVVLTILLGGTV